MMNQTPEDEKMDAKIAMGKAKLPLKDGKFDHDGYSAAVRRHAGIEPTIDDADDEPGISPQAYAVKRLKELKGTDLDLYGGQMVRIDLRPDSDWPESMERDLEEKLAKTKTKVPLTKRDVSSLVKIDNKILGAQQILNEYAIRIDLRLERPKKGGFQLQTVKSQDVKKK